MTSIGYGQIVARAVLAWWQDYDLLLTPTLGAAAGRARNDRHRRATTPTRSPPIERAVPYAVFTAGFNATGQPAISAAAALVRGGLPIGVQLVGDMGREDLLIQVAAQLEEAAPWAERRPPAFAAA